MQLKAGDKKSIYDFAMNDINGKEVNLLRYKGKVLLIVNVASECGYTPQYRDLETLFKKFKDRGFAILGFPANDFGAQEPGTDSEIKTFCDKNYGVTSDLFSKISVKGSGQHHVYKLVTGDVKVGGDVKWNFQKYLVIRSGNLTHKFFSNAQPMSEEIVSAIETALK